MSHCEDPITCPDGNCEGCSNGIKWCQDPRCEPYCRDCEMIQDHDTAVNWTFAIILVGLIAIALVLIFVQLFGCD